MPEVNGSIPASVAVPQNDLFGTVGKALAVKQGLLQNQMLQQDYGARTGLGELIGQATDPVTGETDYNKLMALAAGDRRTAWNLPQIAKDVLERKRGQTMLTKEQFDTHKSVIDASSSALTSLLTEAKPGPDGRLGVSQNDAVAKAVNLLGDKSFGTEAKTALQANVVNLISQLGPDPVKNFQIIQALDIQRQSALDAHNAAYGVPQAVNTGGQTQIVAPNVVTGRTTPLGALTNTPSPDTLTTPTPVMGQNAQGQPVESAITRGQFVNQAQGGPVATGVPMPGGLPLTTLAEPVQVWDPVTKQPKTITKGELLGMGGGSGGAVKVPSTGGVASGPPLGAKEAASVSGAESAKQGVALQQQADAAPARRAALLSMRDQLANFETGPAADKMAHLSALAREFGLPAPISKEGVKATEEFNKLSTQIVLQQVAQLGGAGTDDKLAAGIKGNPSTYLSKQGNKAVTALMLGNEDAIASKNAAWQAWQQHGHGPESYGQFSTQFNGIYDPRVFQAKYMDPKDRALMIKNMSPSEKQAYDNHVRIAVQAGWIK